MVKFHDISNPIESTKKRKAFPTSDSSNNDLKIFKGNHVLIIPEFKHCNLMM